MTVAIAFAVIGGVILIGFFANLLFRLTKIPSVLLLIIIGIILGPVAGWLTSDSLIIIAPFFGTLALMIILFEGGLELEIQSVVRQAPRAAFLAIIVFVLSVGTVWAFAFYILRMPFMHSMLLAGILGASSPAICLPVISGLSIREEIKTILKLESALGDVLLIVTVLLLLDFQSSGGHGFMEMASRFFMSFAVALVIAAVAGALWSRLIGWMGKEPLAYMLTLGFVFLLYFSVEELGGSAAIAVLLFGVMLENMQVIASRVGERVRYLFGFDIRAEQFVLHEFMKNITEELSFLIRTFFFVYLGLLLDFDTLTLSIGIHCAGFVILLLASRWVAVRIIRKRCRLTSEEFLGVLSMVPRGLVTAVMAFLPAQQGIAGTELFPVYAFMAIVLTNLFMTGGVIVAERRLGRGRSKGIDPPEIVSLPDHEESGDFSTVADSAAGSEDLGETASAGASVPHKSGASEKWVAPTTLAGWMSKLFGIRMENREWRYLDAVKASSLSQPLFWVQIFLASALTILGLVLDQNAIIIGAALIVPIAWPIVAAGLALAVGDIYFFIKLQLKLGLAAVMAIALSAAFSALLPYSAVTAEIASRTKPTILDFLVAFFAGMTGAAMLFTRRKVLQFFPGAILAVTLLPPLAVMGFGLGTSYDIAIFQGGAILFTANYFAAILGAALVYAVVGMPELVGLESIRKWKHDELSRPLVNLIFERMRIRKIAGRTGSVQARLVVAVVFLMALVIPLHKAYNQLSLEFRARQAISEVGKMFEIPERSAVINSTLNIGEEAITVRIHVATNSFFESEDIRRFEERISDRTGKPVQLHLVQSLSDIGEGTKIRGILAPAPAETSEYIPTIPEMAAVLREEIAKKLQPPAFPQSITILSVGAELNMARDMPVFRVHYLAETPLSEDAQGILADLLERRMNLNAGGIYFTHTASRYDIKIHSRKGIVETELNTLRLVQDVLTQFPQLRADIAFPGLDDEKRLDSLRNQIFETAPILKDSDRAILKSDLNGTIEITISLQ
jgi:cell volume regulation protein A